MNSALDYFKAISQIPHPSYHEQALSNWVVEFAKEQKLAYIQDEHYNVVIFKPASPGYETAKTVMLQAHLDMVAEKTPTSKHNFLTDPIELLEIYGLLFANDTTLGADDGVGVAYMLAILADKSLKHPALECVFTVLEEVGLIGAMKLDTSALKSEYLIGLDSAGENLVAVACSGGVRGDIFLPIELVANTNPALILKVRGLLGGHSGQLIDLQRANGLKVLGNVLALISQKFSIQLAQLNGGAKENAIARDAEAVLAYQAADKLALLAFIKELEIELQKQYYSSDAKISLEVEATSVTQVLSAKLSQDLIKLLVVLPYGTRFKDTGLANLVVNSANLGVVEWNDDQIRIGSSYRAPQDFVLEVTMNEVSTLVEALGYQMQFKARYPGWPYEPNSPLRQKLKQVYQDLFQAPMEELASQGGVELGVIKGKMPWLDVVGFGPDAYDAHTPNEHLDLASFNRVYDLLITFLSQLI